MEDHSNLILRREVLLHMKNHCSKKVLILGRLFKGLISLVLISLLIIPLTAQGTRLLQQPSVSKRHIAFVHAGDVWIVNRDGGVARQLTSFPDKETYPFLSPDGKRIFFVSPVSPDDSSKRIPSGHGNIWFTEKVKLFRFREDGDLVGNLLEEVFYLIKGFIWSI